MGFRNFLTTRKRRLLPGIQIPMHTEALLSQMKDTVAISRHLPFDPSHQIEKFFQLIDMYPLLCGLLSELQPRNGTLFWDTFGEWLLHKVNHPIPSLDSPRIGPAAHIADIKALKFTTHHLWPASFWRDKHCYRCFIKELGSHPLRLASKQCSRHACQSWALRLLENLREQYPGFSTRSLLPTPRRDRRSTRRRRASSKSPARKGSRRRSPSPNQPARNTEQYQVTMVSPLTNELNEEEPQQDGQKDTRSSTRRRHSSWGSGHEMQGSIHTGNPSPHPIMVNENVTPVIMLMDAFDDDSNRE